MHNDDPGTRSTAVNNMPPPKWKQIVIIAKEIQLRRQVM